MENWDAVETMKRIRAGEVSAAEVLEATIKRAQAAGALNAIVTDTFERARESISAGTPVDGALAGLPMFVKDLSQVKNVATGWGSAGAAGLISKKSDPFVKRLERTGAIVLGKSATPEFGMTATTEPLVRGATRNPWDPTRSVLDMEGSNLLPVNIAVHGCVTRTVRDTVAFHRAMSGLDEVAAAPARALRIGLSVDAPAGTPVDPEMLVAVRAAGRACEALGHTVSEITCPFPAPVIDDFLAYWGFLAWIQVATVRMMLHTGFDKTKIEPWTAGLCASFTSRRKAGVAAIRRRYAAFTRPTPR